MGSIPFGLIITRIYDGTNITQRGSGNIGATNVGRELGLRYGLSTFILDALKGFIPVYITCSLLSENDILIALITISAITGHMFSIFMKFRGGKGVSTAIGAYLASEPLIILTALIIFLISVYIWNFISLASMISMLAVPILMTVFGKHKVFIISSGLIALLIFIKHFENIQRLKRGGERKWRKKDY